MPITVNGIPLTKAKGLRGGKNNLLKNNEIFISNGGIYISSKIAKNFGLIHIDNSNYLFLSDCQELFDRYPFPYYKNKSAYFPLWRNKGKNDGKINTFYKSASIHLYLKNRNYNLEKSDISDIFRTDENILCYEIAPKKEDIYERQRKKYLLSQ